MPPQLRLPRLSSLPSPFAAVTAVHRRFADRKDCGLYIPSRNAKPCPAAEGIRAQKLRCDLTHLARHQLDIVILPKNGKDFRILALVFNRQSHLKREPIAWIPQ